LEGSSTTTAPGLSAENGGHFEGYRASDNWVAEGPAGPNATYLGHRLQYGDVDESVSGVVPDGLAQAEFRRMTTSWITLMILASVLGVYLGATVFRSKSTLSSDAFGIEQGSAFNGTPLMLLLTVATVLAVVLWCRPRNYPVKEWHLVLDGRHGAADGAYASIVRSLQQRRSPIATVPMRMPGTVTGGRPRAYLELQFGEFVALVSCFAFGADLYVGWTMWSRMSALTVVWRSFLQGNVDDYFVAVVLSDDVRAFREVVHAAVREGVDASNRPSSVEDRDWVANLGMRGASSEVAPL
jgi:hypothetical protein